MKHMLLALSLASAASLSASAQTAPAAAPSGPAKIAVIAFQAAVTSTNEFQRSYADIEKKYAPKQDQLKALSTEVDTLKKQLQTQANTLSDTERNSRARSIDEKQKKLQRAAEDDRTAFQQDLQETFNGVAGKVGDVLMDYAKQQGFTVVINSAPEQQQMPTLLYWNPSTDITKAVVDAYNVKSGVPAPPAAAKPAAAPAKP